jgi:hypothetical protein
MTRLAVLAASAALAASATLAFAQAPIPPAAQDRGRESPREERARPPFDRAEMEALVDARIAALQAGLRLTPDQQRYFPAVEQAIREMAAVRIARMERMREARDDRRDRDRPDFL